MAALLLGVISTEFLYYSQNTLHHNENWIASKRLQEVGLNGSDEFLIERSVLAKNKLDLSAYNGFQEIVSKKEFRAQKISFDLELSKNSYLDFFIQEASERTGIRLGESYSFWFKENKTEGFSQTSDLKSGNSSQLYIELQNIGGNLDLYINGKKWSQYSRLLSLGRIGFRAGKNKVVLDNIRIQDKEKVLLEERFRLEKGWVNSFFIITLFWVLLIVLLDKVLMKGKFKSLIAIQLAICIGLIFLFDFFFWSSQPSFTYTKMLRQNQRVYSHQFDRFKIYTLDPIAKWLGIRRNIKKVLKRPPYPRKRTWFGPIFCGPEDKGCTSLDHKEARRRLAQFSHCKKIVWLGTSQTVGAGASSLEKTFVSLTQKNLQAKMKDQCLLSLNLAISGGKSETVYDSFQKDYKDFNFDLMILNFSNNDFESEFMSSMNKILRNLKNKKIVLMEEANSLEFDDSGLREKHKTLRKLAITYQHQSLPFHDFLSRLQKENKGNFWWDVVHFNDLGHHMSSQWLSKELSPYFEKE